MKIPSSSQRSAKGCLPLVQICLTEDPIQVFWQQIGEIPFHGLVLLLALQQFRGAYSIVENAGSGPCLQPRLEQTGKGRSHIDEDQRPQYSHEEGQRKPA